LATPTPNPLDGIGSMSEMAKKPSATKPQPNAKSSSPAPSGGDLSGVGSMSDFANGVTPAQPTQPTSPQAGSPRREANRSGQKTTFADVRYGTLSAPIALLNAAETPLYYLEDTIYQATKDPQKNSDYQAYQKKVADLQAKGDGVGAAAAYYPFLFSQMAKSWNNATAWTKGQDVKHTGGAIAKNLGMINTSKDAESGKDWVGKTQNVLAGLVFDIGLDPMTYVPGPDVIKGLEILTKGGIGLVKGAVKGAAGQVPEWAAKKLLSPEELAKAAETAQKVTAPGKNIIKPRNLRPAGEASDAATKQADYLAKLNETSVNMVKLPDAVDRTIGEKAFDSALSGVDLGLRAAKATLLSARANHFLEKYAKDAAYSARYAKKAAAKSAKDYIYDVGQSAVRDATNQASNDLQQATDNVVEPPKPSEASIAQPKTAKRSRAIMPEQAPTKYEDAMQRVGPQDIKVVKDVLKKLDSVAKKAVGVKPNSAKLSETVSRFIEGIDSRSHAVFKAMDEQTQSALKSAISLKEMNPTMLWKDSLAGARAGTEKARIKKAFVAIYGNKVAQFTTGRDTIGHYLNSNIDTPFNKLPNADKLHLIKGLMEFTNPSGKGNLEELSKLVPDKAVLDELVKAGALDGGGRNEAVRSILGKMTGTAGDNLEAKYKNADELIAGVRAGDSIPADVLMKLVKALNPDNAVIKKLEASAEKPTTEMLSAIIRNEPGVVNTLASMRKRLALADSKMFMKSTGLSSSDTIAAYLDRRTLGAEEITPVIHAGTREVAAKSVSRMRTQDVMTATEVIRETFGKRFDMAEGGVARISDLGDYAKLQTGEAYKGGWAILEDQANQSFQSIISAKLLGITRFRANKAASGAMEAGDVGAVETASTRIANFTLRMAEVRDVLLATTGTRMFVQKERAQVGKDIAENKFSVFIDLGDIVQVFASTPEGAQVIERAMFQDAKRDSLDTLSILKGTMHVLEARQNGSAYDQEALLKVTAFKAKEEPLSKAFKAQKESIAAEFLHHLITQAAPKLEEIHLNRSMAAVEDYIGHSLDISHQVVSTLRDAWVVAVREGRATTEERFRQLRDLFNRFAYITDIVRQQDGAVAEAVMRAASMLFVKGGNLSKAEFTKSIDSSFLDDLSELYRLMPQFGTKDHADMTEMLNEYSRMDNPAMGAPIGRERLPKPSADAVNKASVAYSKAKDAFIAHAKAGLKLDSPEAYKVWRTEAKDIAKQLDKARKGAYHAWLPIEHYSNRLRRFVPVEAYDHEAEQAWAKAHPPRLIGDVLAQVERDAVDAKPVKMEGAGNGGQKAAARVAANAAVKDHNAKLSEALIEDTSADVYENIGAYDALGLEPQDTAMRLEEDAQFEQYNKQIPKADLYVYSPKNMKAENLSVVEKLRQKMSATGGDLAGLTQNAESMIHSLRSDLARVLNHAHSASKDFATGDDWGTALARAISKEGVDELATPEIQALQKTVASVMDSILHEAEIVGVSPEALASKLKHYGLFEKDGFSASGDLKELISNLPFMNRPAGIIDGSAEAIKWAERAAEFEKSTLRPVDVIIKIGSAVHHVKTIQALAGNLTAQAGHLAYGLTEEKAISYGWVKMKSSIPSEIMDSIPEGTLFHPEIAKQVAALDRNWTALQKGQDYGKMTKFVHAMMRQISWWKFTQTTLNPRHHITNLIGDTMFELMRGNFNPMSWHLAGLVAKEAAHSLVKTEWMTKDISPMMDRFLAHETDLASLGKKYSRFTKGGKKVVPVTVNGKTQHMTIAEVVAKMQQRNILTNSYYNDEVSAMYENLVLDVTSSGANRQLVKAQTLRMRMGIEKTLKPFGDFTAIYSNYPRAAGAIDVMLSKEWSSEEAMWTAVAREVHLYHPSIQSLTAGERKYGRLFVGYYTWLRVAHNALLDLAINHSLNAVTIPLKVASNIRQSSGLNQGSLMDPWGSENSSFVPQNMRGSLYGALVNTPEFGPLGIKGFSPAADIMENWQFYYDPAANGDLNQMLGEQGQPLQNLVGGNLNPIAKQISQELFAQDFQTGKKYTDRTPAAVWDRFLQTLGPTQALEGAGLYTPLDKQAPGKGYTKQQQDLKTLKYFTGGKQFMAVDPQLAKVARLEDTARLKMFLKTLPKDQK